MENTNVCQTLRFVAWKPQQIDNNTKWSLILIYNDCQIAQISSKDHPTTAYLEIYNYMLCKFIIKIAEPSGNT